MFLCKITVIYTLTNSLIFPFLFFVFLCGLKSSKVYNKKHLYNFYYNCFKNGVLNLQVCKYNILDDLHP